MWQATKYEILRYLAQTTTEVLMLKRFTTISGYMRLDSLFLCICPLVCFQFKTGLCVCVPN